MTIAVISDGLERTFAEDDIIVSKTDLAGRITYANEVFLSIAHYTEAEVLGAPHSLIRHRDMPRSVFKLLWDTIASGREIFAYVVNRAKDDAFYWVFAHVTPTFDDAGRITGYHSNRRVPEPRALDKIRPIYAALLDQERRHEGKVEGMNAGVALLHKVLQEKGIGYDEFIFSL